jgi:twitching motility protein PilT
VATVVDLLKFVADNKYSDLHIKAGSPPSVRANGDLAKLKGQPLDAKTCNALAEELLDDELTADLKATGEVDFAYSVPGAGRFRVNIHRQRGSLGIAARRILPGAPNFNALGLPPAVEKLANEHRGLLLVTGPTGSGKTTTTGAIISHINHTRACHIVTIEDPIEILHDDAKAIVTQREVGGDTKGFQPALRAAMRQDPDVIFVGEIRDIETVKAALQASETGHLVIATLHTTDVTETVTRIIDFFPADQQKQVRVSLAGAMVGVVSQRLLPRKDDGRVAAIEILINNGRVRDCIIKPEETHGIYDIVAESNYYGMQTFDQALVELFRTGMITLEDAMNAATNPHDFQLKLQQEGLQPV